jgi:shikimate dehydrogenase
MPSTAPDRYGLLGNPVAHSRSPFIHAAFAAQTGEAMVYERVFTPLDGFEATLRAFAAGGGRGCNITVPFKLDAFALCSRRSERALLAEAVNVIRFDAEGWFGDNTDGAGLLADIQLHARQALAGLRVLLIGAGGAAAGVLGPLLAAAPAEVVVANRTPERARALCARHAAFAKPHGAELHASGLDAPGRQFDVVINASASSLAGDAAPVPPVALKPGTLAIDLMYGAAAVPFLRWAEGHGARSRDGLGMLVEQAAEAFAVWRGVRPVTGTVLAALRGQLAAEAAAS